MLPRAFPAFIFIENVIDNFPLTRETEHKPSENREMRFVGKSVSLLTGFHFPEPQTTIELFEVQVLGR